MFRHHVVDLTPMSHLRIYRAIWSRNFIARQSCSMQLCMSHTANLWRKAITGDRPHHTLYMSLHYLVKYLVPFRLTAANGPFFRHFSVVNK